MNLSIIIDKLNPLVNWRQKFSW